MKPTFNRIVMKNIIWFVMRVLYEKRRFYTLTEFHKKLFIFDTEITDMDFNNLKTPEDTLNASRAIMLSSENDVHQFWNILGNHCLNGTSDDIHFFSELKAELWPMLY